MLNLAHFCTKYGKINVSINEKRGETAASRTWLKLPMHMLTALDFEKLGFWEDSTPEENITVYGMDFGTDYIMLTDDLGKTPVKENNFIVVAAYDDADCFLWGVELKDFAALEELCAQHPANSSELLEALRTYKLPKKK